MKLPYLFRQIHGSQIFNIWVGGDQPSIVRIVPQEPLGGVVCVGPPKGANDCVTIINVRCKNNRGAMEFEAASVLDLKIAQEWAARHKHTAPEAFKWFPTLAH